MSVDPERLTRRLLGDHWQHLSSHEREVVLRVARRARNPAQEFHDNRSFGERTADAIAAFGGSWSFSLLFFSLLATWTLVNTEILGPRHDALDPYPYVFLNLILSMLAAIQAPIIMMSQNRAGDRDRLEANIDHEVNVRAELSVRGIDRRLHRIKRHLGLVTRAESHVWSDQGQTPT